MARASGRQPRPIAFKKQVQGERRRVGFGSWGELDLFRFGGMSRFVVFSRGVSGVRPSSGCERACACRRRAFGSLGAGGRQVGGVWSKRRRRRWRA